MHLILDCIFLLKYIYFDYILVLETFCERAGKHQVKIRCIGMNYKESLLEPGLNFEAQANHFRESEQVT